MREGGRFGSTWRRQLCGVHGRYRVTMGRWFDDNLVKVVGDATRMFF